jgi:hypothetical protein
MKLRVSYHPLGLADISIHVIVVHRQLAQPVVLVPLQDDYKVLEHPVAAEPIPGL